MSAPKAGAALDNLVWQFRRLRSLWDMYALDAQRFVRIMMQLKMVETIVENVTNLANEGVPIQQIRLNGRVNRAGAAYMLNEEWEALAEDLRQMELDACIPSLERLRFVYERTINAPPGEAPLDARPLFQEFNGRLIDQLQNRSVFAILPKRAIFYSTPALFGMEVEEAFPSASPEIAEAGKCFALDRYSASVFHLMRALEVGIQCLGKVFPGIQTDHQNWQTILDQIDKRVRGMNSQSHGANWKDEQQFYSEAVAHFLVLKNAWRNYAMHLHERYDEERATDIYNSVRAFMRQLSKKLKE